MEVETSLTGNSEGWESTRNVEETLGDTTMDTTMDESELGARSCVAQRTRSHTEEMREKTAETRKLNLSKLREMYTEMREKKDKLQMEVSWELLEHGAIDSLNLPAYQKKADLDDFKHLCNTMDVLEKSFKEMSMIEKKHKQQKGVTWKDREPVNQTENKEGNEEGKPSDTTYVMEDPNYKAALKIVNHALETLLNMKINIVNMNYMENVVKIIISLSGLQH